MESNFKKLFSSVNGGRAVNSTNKLGQNRRQFTPTRSMPPDTVQLSQAQGGLGENVRLTKKKIGLSRNYKNRNTIAAFDGSKVISADTIGNLAKKEFKDSNKFTRKFILQFLHTKLGKCQNDDSKLTNLILSIKNTVTTKGNLAATTNDDIKLALTFLNKILEGTDKYNETISKKMMDTLDAFSKVDEISDETKNKINKQKQAVISKKIELALNTRDEDVIANTINQLGVSALDPENTKQAINELGVLAQNPLTTKQAIQELGDLALDSDTRKLAIQELGVLAQNPKTGYLAINKLGDIVQNSGDENVINNVMTQLVNIARNPKAREQVINKLGDIAQKTNVDKVHSYAFFALYMIALTPEAREQAIQELGVLAQNPLTTKQAIQRLVVLAQNREAGYLAINKLGDIAQDPKVDQETKEKAINGLGDIAQNSGDENVINNVMTQLVNIAQNSKVDPNIRKNAVFQLGLLVQNDNPTIQNSATSALISQISGIDNRIRESYMDDLKTLAQKTETDDLAINQLGVLAQNPVREIRRSAIMQFTFIVLDPGIAEKTKEKAINKLGDIAQDPKVDQETRNFAIRQLSVCARNDKTSKQFINGLGYIAQDPKVAEKTKEKAINKLGDIAQNPKVDQETKEEAINGLGAIAQDPNPKIDKNTKEKAINKLGDIAQDPKVDQETKDFVIRQLGAIAKSKEYYQSIALQKLSAIAQRDILTLEKKTTTIESVVSILKDVAQMYPASVKNKLEFLTQNIQACKTDQDIKDNKTVSELLEFINSAINDIDKEYPNAKEIENKNIEENNKKKAYFSQNS